jgi:transposase InsO family protein
LIRKMSLANPLWGAPRIHGELLKLGIEVSQATVAKYMVRRRQPPSQTWRTFLNTHAKQLVSTDFFVVPTATFRVLYVFVVLAHERRRLLHFNVTSHPSSEWAAQQIVEAFAWDNVPRYLLRDRDAIYGQSFRARVRGMGVREVLTAPQSPWQNPYAERLIGSIRHECLDHVIVFNESSLRRLFKLYFTYYLRSRTHLALGKDSPVSIQVTTDNTLRKRHNRFRSIRLENIYCAILGRVKALSVFIVLTSEEFGSDSVGSSGTWATNSFSSRSRRGSFLVSTTGIALVLGPDHRPLPDRRGAPTGADHL